MSLWRELELGTRWPLVGRTAELAQLATALDERRHIVVSGGAGVGKTRLVAEAAQATGRPVVQIAATAAAADLPLGALAPLLPAGIAAVGVASAVRSMVEAIGAGVLLVVDDAHLLDSASAGVVHQLASRGVAMVVTIRSGAQAPDAITALWKSDEGMLVELRPLPVGMIAELLERVLRGQVDSGAIHQFAVRSGGYPLFVRELVRSALDGGVLVRRRELWLLVRELPFEDRLNDLLPLRVETLARPLRRLAELVALAEPVPLDVLLSLVSVHTLELAEQQGLVTVRAETTGHAVRLAHPLYGDAVRSILTTSRRLRLFGELADALGPVVPDDVLQLRRGVFELEAGRRCPPDQLLELCQVARPLDPALAIRFARAATDSGGVAAAVELAELLAHAQRPDEMEAVLSTLDMAALPVCERVKLTAARALSLSFAAHRPEVALTVLDEAAELGPLPPLQAARAVALMRMGRMGQASELAEPLARDEALPSAVRMHASFTALAALAMHGQSARALDLAAVAEGLLPTATADVPQAAGTLRLLLGLAKFIAGDLAGERALAEAGLEQCLADGSVGERLQFTQVLGRIATMSGRPRLAVRLLRETYAGDGLWWEATRPWTQALLAEALALAGEPRQAREVLAEADQRPGSAVYRPQVLLAGAEVEAAEGATSAAIEKAQHAAEIAEADGHYWAALLAAHAVIRYGAVAAESRVSAVASHVDGAFSPAIVEFANARAGDDAAGMEQAAAMFGLIGAHWFEAEARAYAVRTYRANGRQGLAAIAGERLRSTLRAVEPLATPALMGTGQLEALTSREAEVARLAANGYSDREIAGRLGLSVRTAQTHLTHIYSKLGVAGRHRLIELLQGIDPHT